MRGQRMAPSSTPTLSTRACTWWRQLAAREVMLDMALCGGTGPAKRVRAFSRSRRAASLFIRAGGGTTSDF